MRSRAEPSIDEGVPSADEVWSEVERITASPDFPGSERHAQLLRFLTREALEGAAHTSAYAIATEVLGRDASFDPQIDPIVRVEIGRLRRALEAYHLKHPEEGLYVEVPKGAYRARFSRAGSRETTPKGPAETTPSLVILPIVNGNGVEHDYLAFGLTEELLVALTRFDELRVYVYRERLPEKASEVEIGRSTGARFVLTGTLREANDIIRVTMRLTDSTTGRQLWGESFERELTAASLFSILDDVAARIASLLADAYGIIPRTLHEESRARRTESIDAYEGVLRFHDALWHWDENGFRVARTALERAVAADPSYAWPLAALAGLYANDYLYYLAEPEPALATAERLARRAVALDPQCQKAHWAMAYVHYCKHEREAFENELEQAMALNPHYALFVGDAGTLYALSGSWPQGLTLIRRSMALNPFYPRWYHGVLSVHAYVEGRYEDALAEAGRIAMPDFFWDPVLRAVCLVRLKRIDEANSVLETFTRTGADWEEKGPHIVRAVIFSDELACSILDDLAAARPGWPKTVPSRTRLREA